MNTGFVVQGLAFGVGFVLVSGVFRGRLRAVIAALAVAVAVGDVLVGLFHSSASADGGSPFLHVAGATAAIVGGNLVALLLGLHWRRDALGRFSVGLGLVGLISVTVLVAGTGLPIGVLERLAVYASLLGQVLVAVRIKGTSRVSRG